MALAALRLEDLLRSSPSLAAHSEGLGRAAATSAPILILGEPGVGRSSLARALHQESPRHAEPLIEVDPAALPPTLFESELFGFRAGAFSGADRNQDGRVARAEGGTLVLDQVETIPLPAQPKLLRLLAERRYGPLGGAEREANVRFIALAGEDLPERVETGVFRRDLFHRLEVLAFRLPPLRERRGDLPPLAAALLDDLAGRLARRTPRLSEAALSWMASYAWPGNLRELRNVLERALILASKDATELDPAPPAALAGSAPPTLEAVEIAHIRRVLAHTRGHQGRAAEILGISRKNLWERRRRHGIP